MNRKENILKSAIELFARENFEKVSTLKIAQKSKVSEGLIFKHYQNKKTLFAAVIEKVQNKTHEMIEEILLEENPLMTIRKSIEMPFDINTKDYKYWKLLYKNRWETKYNNEEKMLPLQSKLTWAFKCLDYDEPEKEAGMLTLIINSMTANIIREGRISQLQYKYFIIHKYTL